MEKRIYNGQELLKMDLSELYNIALWNKIDTLNKPRAEIIAEIIGDQMTRSAGRDAINRVSTPGRVYVIAKVTGLPYKEVKYKYEEARGLIESYGYTAVIPTDVIPADSSWPDAMRTAISLLLTCDAYTLLDPVHTTAGGMIEKTIAEWVGIHRCEFSEL